MTIDTTEFEIGSRGWLYRQWVGRFYPDDMPEDWWFSYYSNQFRSVLVPAELINQSKMDTVSDWLESCSDEFNFYIELNPNSNWGDINTKIACLDEQLAGFVVRAKNLPDSKLERLENMVSSALKIAPTYIDTQIADIIRFNGDSVCGDELGCVCEINELQADWVKPFARAVVLISSANGQEPVQLRKMIQSCLSNTSLVVYSLFFAGSQPEVEAMETMQTLYTLME